jgi:hypothetical protein
MCPSGKNDGPAIFSGAVDAGVWCSFSNIFPWPVGQLCLRQGALGKAPRTGGRETAGTGAPITAERNEMMHKFKLQTSFILVILVVSQSNLCAVNVGASERLANLQPSEEDSIYLPLVLNVISLTSLVVTSMADVVNGDTSSPGALIANPGTDGISLREAIVAANNGSGPLTITFAANLAGQTFTITSSFFVTRDGITLTGLSTSDGQPNIIIDASGLPPGIFIPFFIDASDFALSHVRIIGTNLQALAIRAGEWLYLPPAPSEVRNIRIEDNVFDNSGMAEDTLIDAIRVWTGGDGKDAIIENVRIVGNMFRGYTGNGVILALTGTNNVIRNVTIQNNQFIDTGYPVEIVNASGTNNRILGTKIIENVFTNGLVPLFIANAEARATVAPSSGNIIADTLVWGNVFSGNYDSVGMVGGGTYAIGNVIRDVQIVNNIIDTGCGIRINGGWGNASGNQIEGVQIINNTIRTQPLAGLAVFSNPDTSYGNVVTGVSVLNTIFRRSQPEVPTPEEEIAGEITVDQVKYSITSTPGFAGINGNLAVDPKYINPSQGDFHLQPGSPAIDAGSSEGAPARDLECHDRFDDPATLNTGAGIFTYYDMGAFEFNGPLTQCLLEGQW